MSSQEHLPTANRVQFLIPLGWQGRGQYLTYAQTHGLGLEITAFCSGPALNNADVRRERLRVLRDELRDHRRPAHSMACSSTSRCTAST